MVISRSGIYLNVGTGLVSSLCSLFPLYSFVHLLSTSRIVQKLEDTDKVTYLTT